jgi:hypothetical protein
MGMERGRRWRLCGKRGLLHMDAESLSWRRSRKRRIPRLRGACERKQRRKQRRLRVGSIERGCRCMLGVRRCVV